MNDRIDQILELLDAGLQRSGEWASPVFDDTCWRCERHSVDPASEPGLCQRCVLELREERVEAQAPPLCEYCGRPCADPQVADPGLCCTCTLVRRQDDFATHADLVYRALSTCGDDCPLCESLVASMVDDVVVIRDEVEDVTGANYTRRSLWTGRPLDE